MCVRVCMCVDGEGGGGGGGRVRAHEFSGERMLPADVRGERWHQISDGEIDLERRQSNDDRPTEFTAQKQSAL